MFLFYLFLPFKLILQLLPGLKETVGGEFLIKIRGVLFIPTFLCWQVSRNRYVHVWFYFTIHFSPFYLTLFSNHLLVLTYCLKLLCGIIKLWWQHGKICMPFLIIIQSNCLIESPPGLQDMGRKVFSLNVYLKFDNLIYYLKFEVWSLKFDLLFDNISFFFVATALFSMNYGRVYHWTWENLKL